MVKANAYKLDLRVIVYRDENSWCAHCLELDLAQSAGTVAQALRDLKSALTAHLQYAIDHDELGGAFKPAPSEYWKMYFKAMESERSLKASRPVRRFEIRELAA